MTKIEKALRKLDSFSLQFIGEYNTTEPWLLYNPFVEGDAIALSFESFDDVIKYLETRK